MDWLALAVTIALAVVGGIVWLVRLEGKNTANAVSIKAIDARLNSHVLAQDRTHDDLIRVQEQLKYLTSTMQQWMASPQRAREP